jgi:hypothetical protein
VDDLVALVVLASVSLVCVALVALVLALSVWSESSLLGKRRR